MEVREDQLNLKMLRQLIPAKNPLAFWNASHAMDSSYITVDEFKQGYGSSLVRSVTELTIACAGC
jgi:hypothetical protein